MRLKALIAGAATARDSYSLVQFIGHCTVLLLRCASLAHADNISIKINRDKIRPRGMVHKLPFITVHLHGRHDTQTLLCRWGLLKRFEAEETPLPPATLVLSMPGALNGHQQRTFGSLLGTYSLVAGREAHGRPVSVCLCVCVSASCVASTWYRAGDTGGNDVSGWFHFPLFPSLPSLSLNPVGLAANARVSDFATSGLCSERGAGVRWG